MPHPYIAIEGVIGVGKTTLARYLQQTLSAELLLEVFEENPFLSDFYADRDRYAFQTQIFFLLSRYRQQHQIIPQTVARQTLVSDYMFAKDSLFANLNLVNDELAVYKSVYAALAERIPAPGLIVYLRANVDTLMERIAIRDRPYERNMERAYIQALQQAYETFFDDYAQSPTLTITTDTLNIVQNAEARQIVIGQIQSALSEGATQPALPHLADTPDPLTQIFAGDNRRRLPDFQQFHRALDANKRFSTDLYANFMHLTEELGELGAELAKVRRAENTKYAAAPPPQALQLALTERRLPLQRELADCMACLLKLSNYAGINLEAAYLEKMNANMAREWPAEKAGATDDE